MVLLIALLVLWMPCAVTRLLRARGARCRGPRWTASDDRHLTALLVASAPRTPTE
jgi:hypothetical protein